MKETVVNLKCDRCKSIIKTNPNTGDGEGGSTFGLSYCVMNRDKDWTYKGKMDLCVSCTKKLEDFLTNK